MTNLVEAPESHSHSVRTTYSGTDFKPNTLANRVSYNRKPKSTQDGRDGGSLPIDQALRQLDNLHLGANDLVPAARVVVENREHIHGVTAGRVQEVVETHDGKNATVIFEDPRLTEVKTPRRRVVILDNRKSS